MRGFVAAELPGSLDGMQGVRGSNPLSSTPGQRPNPASAVPDRPPQAADWQQPPLPRLIRSPREPYTSGVNGVVCALSIASPWSPWLDGLVRCGQAGCCEAA